MGVSSNAWRPKANLAVGVYSWRVKEGKPAGDAKWSKGLDFLIPPAIPTPLAPSTRYPTEPVKPVFEWTCPESTCTSFTLQLFEGADSLGTMTATGNVKSLTAKSNEACPPAATRGASVHPHPEQIYGRQRMGALHEFPDRGPAPRLHQTRPAQMFDPGLADHRLRLDRADGAAAYTLKVLFNGMLLDTISGLTSPHYPLPKAFQLRLLFPPCQTGEPGRRRPLSTSCTQRAQPHCYTRHTAS